MANLHSLLLFLLDRVPFTRLHGEELMWLWKPLERKCSVTKTKCGFTTPISFLFFFNWTDYAFKGFNIFLVSRNAFRDELALLQKIRHPNVVQFLGAVTQSNPMMIVTEYLPKVFFLNQDEHVDLWIYKWTFMISRSLINISNWNIPQNPGNILLRSSQETCKIKCQVLLETNNNFLYQFWCYFDSWLMTWRRYLDIYSENVSHSQNAQL